MLGVGKSPKKGRFSTAFPTQRQQKNLIFMQAKAKRGFLDWVKQMKRPCVMSRIADGTMSQETLEKHFADFEKWSDDVKLQADNSRLQKVIASQKADILRVKSQLSERKKKVSELKKANKLLQKAQSQTKANEEDQALIDSLQHENRDIKAQLSDLGTELDKSNSNAEHYRMRVIDCNKRIENQRKQLNQFQDHIVQAKAEFKSENDDLKAQLSEKDKLNVDLESRLHRSEAELQKLETLKNISVFDFLTASMDQTRQAKQLKQEMKRLNKEFAKTRNEITHGKEKSPETKPKVDLETKSRPEDKFLAEMKQKYTEDELAMLKGQLVTVYCNTPGTIERDLSMLEIDVKIVIARNHGKLRDIQSKASADSRSFVFCDGRHSHSINHILSSRNIKVYRIESGDNATNIVAKMIEILKNAATTERGEKYDRARAE
ncbi:MAG: hypothetical protein KIG14_02550 [Candidatus Sacchiramonaceae bacterium]|nr:hypothetical protein [Candidatus Saccharimonadaceae bacterium]